MSQLLCCGCRLALARWWPLATEERTGQAFPACEHSAAHLTAPPLHPARLPTCSYQQQATVGDNTAERPMWAEKGGLDFEGRARWDAWTAVKASPTVGTC